MAVVAWPIFSCRRNRLAQIECGVFVLGSVRDQVIEQEVPDAKDTILRFKLGQHVVETATPLMPI